MKNYFNTRDSYIVYKNMSDNPINITQYVQINNQFMKFLMSKLFETGEINIPERLGKLTISGKKVKVRIEDGEIKGLAPDWVKTKELWDNNPKAKEEKKLLYHTNNHTDNTIYKFLWSKNRILITNKILYSLRMTRDNKRKVYSLINNGKKYVTKFI